MDRLVTETVEAVPVAQELEWFISLINFDGKGSYWCAGTLTRSEREAEDVIRNYTAEVKMARIARVMLPCRVIA